MRRDMALRASGLSALGGLGWAVLGATSLIVGCEESGVTSGADAGPDAAIGYVSAPGAGTAPNDGSTAEGADTLTVRLDEVGTSGDELSVDLDGRSDAAAPLDTATSEAATSEAGHTTAGVSGETVALSGSTAPSEDTTPSQSTALSENTAPSESTALSENTADSSGTQTAASSASSSANTTEASTTTPSTEASETVDPLTSSEPDATGAATEGSSLDSISSSDATSDVDVTSEVVPPQFPGTVTGTADWVDLPATFSAVVNAPAGATFIWELTGFPEGSRVRTSDLQGNGTAQVTFYPDVAGGFEVLLTLTVGEQRYTREASVQVSAVDVGYIAVEQDYASAVYRHIPRMVSTDARNTPRDVGCSFQSDDPYASWLDDLWPGARRSFGFKYPNVPSDPTLMAYRMRYFRDVPDATQVATVNNDCGNSRPADLPGAYSPAFSPEGKRLAFVSGAGIYNLPIDGSNGDPLVSLYGPQVVSWWSPESIAWLGQASRSQFGIGVVKSESPSETSWLMDCANVRDLASLIEFEMGPDFVIARDWYGTWWYLILRENAGTPFISCAEEDNSPLDGVEAAAISPDGKELALVRTRIYADARPEKVVEMGPVSTLFSGQRDWSSATLTLERSYTGLHWIAGNKQVAFTELALERDAQSRITDVLESAILRVNRDGTRLTPLVKVASERAVTRVATTGTLFEPIYQELTE